MVWFYSDDCVSISVVNTCISVSFKWMNSIWVRMEPLIIFTLSLSTADIVPVIHRLISIRCKVFWSLSLSLFRFICSFKHISCNSASLAVWFIVNFTDGDARAWSSLYIYHFRWQVFFLNSSCVYSIFLIKGIRTVLSLCFDKELETKNDTNNT
jgi:hypothetical protein